MKGLLYTPVWTELVDAPDLGSGALWRRGSSPLTGTIRGRRRKASVKVLAAENYFGLLPIRRSVIIKQSVSTNLLRGEQYENHDDFRNVERT